MIGPFLRKYGVQTTFNFDLFEVDGVDFRVDAVHATGDTVIMKDEGAEGNTSNGFTDEGTGYSIVLDATEMQAARIVVYAVDQTATKVWLDAAIVIETYGNASAMHAFDLDTAYTGPTKAEMDTAHGLLATVAALTTVDNEIAAIDTVVDGIQTDLDNGTDGLGALLTQINLIGTNTNTIIASIIVGTGTADSGTTTTLVDAGLTQADDDWWLGCKVVMLSGSLDGQVRTIVGFTASSDTIEVFPAFTAAVSTQAYYIVAGSGTVSSMTAGAVQDLFTTDSGETIATAVDGSVVKEIAKNGSYSI